MQAHKYLFFIALLFFALPVSASNPVSVPHTFNNGQVADADEVNENFLTLASGIVPVGTILPWHKSLDTSVILSDNWVECNGQTLSDTDSVYDGKVIPNLNGEGRFLRGNAVSGVMQEDQMQSHKHTDAGHGHNVSHNASSRSGAHGGGPYPSSEGSATINIQTGYANLGDPTDSETGAGEPRHGNETRPKNMSVVWIIRVK